MIRTHYSDIEFYRRVLDFYINTDFIPNPWNTYFLEDYPFFGTSSNIGRIKSKAAVFDFDGVFEKIGTKPLYILVAEALARKNSALDRRFGDLEKCFKSIQETGDIIKGQNDILEIYQYCDIREPHFDAAYEQA